MTWDTGAVDGAVLLERIAMARNRLICFASILIAITCVSWRPVDAGPVILVDPAAGDDATCSPACRSVERAFGFATSNGTIRLLAGSYPPGRVVVNVPRYSMTLEARLADNVVLSDIELVTLVGLRIVGVGFAGDPSLQAFGGGRLDLVNVTFSTAHTGPVIDCRGTTFSCTSCVFSRCRAIAGGDAPWISVKDAALAVTASSSFAGGSVLRGKRLRCLPC